MNFFAKNQLYLKKIKTAFAVGEEEAFPPEEDAVYTKKDGHYLAERNNVKCFVHSTYNVPDEIQSMFASTPNDVQYILLYGCGRGEAVRYALDPQNFPELKALIIIEPSPAWTSIVMNETDMEKNWGQADARISFLAGYHPQHVSYGLAGSLLYMKKNFSIVYHLATRTLFSEYYQEMSAIIIEKLCNISVSIYTNKDLIPKKICNGVLNLSLPAYDYANMMDLFKGKNIIIVSAGPSLEKNIQLLTEAKKKAIVLAVGSAIHILDARGIIPHFRVSFDPSAEQYAVFSKLHNNHVPLIYTNSIYPEILLRYQGPRICANTEYDSLSCIFNEKRGLKTAYFLSGPTVANLAAEIVCASGCQRLVFVGQDMCMYNYHLHADTGEYLPYKSYQNQKDMLYLKDISGNDVISPRNYYMIKEALENTVARYDGKVEFINATEGGLGIKGAANKPLADVLAGWDDDDSAPALGARFEKIEMIDYGEELAELEDSIGKIDLLNDKNLEDLRKARDIFLKDERLLRRERYFQTVKEVRQNENELKKIKWYREFIHPYLEMFLHVECLQWEKDIDSPDEKTGLRAILEIQLHTAQTTKNFTATFKRALEAVFAGKIKTGAFSLSEQPKQVVYRLDLKNDIDYEKSPQNEIKQTGEYLEFVCEKGAEFDVNNFEIIFGQLEKKAAYFQAILEKQSFYKDENKSAGKKVFSAMLPLPEEYDLLNISFQGKAEQCFKLSAYNEYIYQIKKDIKAGAFDNGEKTLSYENRMTAVSANFVTLNFEQKDNLSVFTSIKKRISDCIFFKYNLEDITSFSLDYKLKKININNQKWRDIYRMYDTYCFDLRYFEIHAGLPDNGCSSDNTGFCIYKAGYAKSEGYVYLKPVELSKGAYKIFLTYTEKTVLEYCTKKGKWEIMTDKFRLKEKENLQLRIKMNAGARLHDLFIVKDEKGK